jgi:hypothetical protein
MAPMIGEPEFVLKKARKFSDIITSVIILASYTNRNDLVVVASLSYPS